MRNPRDYWKSAITGQILATVLYLVIGSVVYAYAGICASFFAAWPSSLFFAGL